MASRPPLPSWSVERADAGVRLDKFLAAADRLRSRARAADAIARGKVFVNGREARRADAAAVLRAGDVVRVWMDRPGSARARATATDAGIEILYEDRTLIVVNKPAGLLAVPLQQRSDASSAQALVARHLRSRGQRRPLVVHRIDRDTSGIVVFATNPRAQEQLKDQFERREPERVYWAVVYGHPEPPQGTWRDDLVWDRDALLQKRAHPGDPRKKEAITDYRVVERLAGASLLELRLRTGKRNQIRIQARLHGHMLVGEKLYVHGPPSLRPIDFPRQALHACRLTFRHPVDGRVLTFEAPMPGDMASLVERLRA